MMFAVGEGGGWSARTNPPYKENPRKKHAEENCLGQEPESPHGKPRTRLGS